MLYKLYIIYYIICVIYYIYYIICIRAPNVGVSLYKYLYVYIIYNICNICLPKMYFK